jgi:starch synthase (maltosyl-transferring)
MDAAVRTGAIDDGSQEHSRPMVDSQPERRRRVAIARVRPEIGCGRFPIKRVVGEPVVVEADVYGEGHDAVACALLHRQADAAEWTRVSMRPLPNDRWQASFEVTALGLCSYTIEAWFDRLASWRRDLVKKLEGKTLARVDLLTGAEIIEDGASRATGADADRLRAWAAALRADRRPRNLASIALDEDLAAIAARYPDLRLATRYAKELAVRVDPVAARFSTWYELFPRSCAPEAGRHGTFRDVERRLDYVAGMGFDILYLPPIHPIGRTHRKGKGNAVTCGPDDVGSPWAIGAAEGGHMAVHPQLGTVDDVTRLVAAAGERGMRVALDLAFQCTPDHPWVREHPAWFRWRPDQTIQHAENPPKKYEDIYPLDFETEGWRELWEELKRVVLFWIERGVRTFRVDNPHTKPFTFWEWLIGEIKSRYPDVIFLGEAFTRPNVMYELAKLGFTQSYTYFAWRNTKQELTDYFTDLTSTEAQEFFRPNLWPNTPDILPEYLQFGGRPAFMARLVLAATLGASYGIYGPAFELCENQPLLQQVDAGPLERHPGGGEPGRPPRTGRLDRPGPGSARTGWRASVPGARPAR